MDTRDLEAFLLVAEIQNIQKASKRSGMSPSTISKVIQRLEKEHDVKLFDRGGRNIFLSKEGQFYKNRFQQILNLYKKTLQESNAQQVSFKIRWALPQSAIYFVGSLIEKVRRSFPLVQFELTTESTPNIITKLRKGEVDLILTSHSLPNDLDSKKVFHLDYDIYAGQGHPLFEKAKSGVTLTLDEVLKYSFIAPKDNIFSNSRQEGFKDCWLGDYPPRKISLVVDSYGAFQALLEKGLALGYFPNLPDCDSKLILPLKIKGDLVKQRRIYHLACRDKSEFGWTGVLF